ATITNNTNCRWVVTVICWRNTATCGYLPGSNPPVLQQCCIQWEQAYIMNPGQVRNVPICNAAFTTYKATDFPNGSCTGSSEIAWSTFGSLGNPPCDSVYPVTTSATVPNCACNIPATISMVTPNQVEIN